MPRPLRIEYEGAWYHVMNRGANYQNIFNTDQHRRLFLSLLAEIKLQFCVEVHSYCLMNNHYHLLIHTPLANLSKAMRYLDSVYTQKFNRMMNRDGPLFRGRYKSILIEEDTYLLQVSRYIHLNPVVANICEYPHQFEWSSFRDFLLHQPAHAWVSVSFLHTLLGGDNPQKKYREFVLEGLDQETKNFYKKINLASIFGSRSFAKSKLESLDEKYKANVLSDVNRTKNLLNINSIAELVANYYQIDVAGLKISISGMSNIPRIIAIYLSRKLGLHSHQNISQYFTGIHYRSISGVLKRGESLINTDKQIKDAIDAITLSAISEANLMTDGT